MEMNEVAMTSYIKAYERAVIKLQNWYDEYKDDTEEKALRDLLWENYKRKNLDPDGRFIKSMYGVDCTADALLSVWRICQMEKSIDDIVPVYKRYRKMPVFYFPCEQGGINQTRSTVFGDRIDCTLYDLKKYFLNGNTDSCRLKRALDRPITAQWLWGVQSFENLVDIYNVKGVFIDDDYQVIDLDTGGVLSDYPPASVKLLDWSQDYYTNVKVKLDEWYIRAGVEQC